MKIKETRMDNGRSNVEMTLVAAGALLRENGEVLVQKRRADQAFGRLWEFPGGKIEAGETAEVALARELAEELAIEIDIETLIPVGFSSSRDTDRPLLLLLFACHSWRGEVVALQAETYAWVHPEALLALAMPPLDVPLIGTLGRYLTTA